MIEISEHLLPSTSSDPKITTTDSSLSPNENPAVACRNIRLSHRTSLPRSVHQRLVVVLNTSEWFHPKEPWIGVSRTDGPETGSLLQSMFQQLSNHWMCNNYSGTNHRGKGFVGRPFHITTGIHLTQLKLQKKGPLWILSNQRTCRNSLTNGVTVTLRSWRHLLILILRWCGRRLWMSLNAAAWLQSTLKIQASLRTIRDIWPQSTGNCQSLTSWREYKETCRSWSKQSSTVVEYFRNWRTGIKRHTNTADPLKQLRQQKVRKRDDQMKTERHF